MQKTGFALTLALALCLGSTAHAQSVVGDGTAESRADALAELLMSKGLVQRLEGVRQQMSSTASELVVTAMGFLGVPYRRGGESAETGFDCSGFVRAIYEQTVGLVLPRRAAEQAQATEIINREDLKPGDLVFFNTMRKAFSHVGIYVGDGKFIHSPRSGAQVRVEDMRTAYWQTRFNGARRVAPVATADNSSPAAR
jgi:cell wall-associated NlpC family hydrolase